VLIGLEFTSDCFYGGTVLIGAVLAIVIVKQMNGGIGKKITFMPAVAARVIVENFSFLLD